MFKLDYSSYTSDYLNNLLYNARGEIEEVRNHEYLRDDVKEMLIADLEEKCVLVEQVLQSREE